MDFWFVAEDAVNVADAADAADTADITDRSRPGPWIPWISMGGGTCPHRRHLDHGSALVPTLDEFLHRGRRGVCITFLLSAISPADLLTVGMT